VLPAIAATYGIDYRRTLADLIHIDTGSRVPTNVFRVHSERSPASQPAVSSRGDAVHSAAPVAPGGRRSAQREGVDVVALDDGNAPRRATAGEHRDVLLAADAVGHRGRPDACLGVKAPEPGARRG